MTPLIPPLTGLRTFVVAAQTENFKRASELLHVTPTAVSAQISALESNLNCKLFTREHRRVRLTESGRTLYEGCKAGFALIQQSVEIVQRNKQQRVLSIGVGPLFASEWLMPRLDDFYQLYPNINLHLHYTPARHSFADSGLDAIITWSPNSWSDVRCDLLFPVEVTPVAAPALISKHGLPKAPKDLLSFPLLHDYAVEGWIEWFARYDIRDPRIINGPVIRHGNVLLRAATRGQGVILGLVPFIKDDLATKVLVRVFPKEKPLMRAFNFISAPTEEQNETVQIFRDWILKVAKSTS